MYARKPKFDFWQTAEKEEMGHEGTLLVSKKRHKTKNDIIITYITFAGRDTTFSTEFTGQIGLYFRLCGYIRSYVFA